MNQPSATSPAGGNGTGEAQPAGPKRAIEVLRRIILLAGVLSAGALAVWPAEALLRVRTVDFAKEQKKKVRRTNRDLQMMARLAGTMPDASLNPAATMAVDAYMQGQLRDRRIDVSDRTWQGFYADVSRTLSGAETTYAARLGEGLGDGFVYFRPQEAPWAELAGQLGPNAVFRYVVLSGDGPPKYLEALFQRPCDFLHYAPAHLAYPYRRYAVWPFLSALLAYAFVPRRRRTDNEIFYAPGSCVTGPDMMGTVLCLVFFLAPIFIISHNMASSGPMRLLDFEDGWGFLTVIFWAFVVFWLSIHVTALYYATFSLWLLPEGLARQTLLGRKTAAYADVEAVELATWSLPRWVRITMALAAAGNWRLAGPILLGASARQAGIALRLRSGEVFKVWTGHLLGSRRIEQALSEHGLIVPPQVRDLFYDEDGQPQTADKPSRAGKVVAGSLLALTVTAALAVHCWPTSVPHVDRELRYTDEELAHRMQLTEEMKRVAGQMQEAMALAADANHRSAAMARHEALMEKYQDLDRQYDAIQPTEEP